MSEGRRPRMDWLRFQPDKSAWPLLCVDALTVFVVPYIKADLPDSQVLAEGKKFSAG
jgi:hypothetical protein